MKTKLEKTFERVDDIIRENSEKEATLRSELKRLENAAEEAQKRKEEAIRTNNEELYNSALFAKERSETEFRMKANELEQLMQNPVIDHETADELTDVILSELNELKEKMNADFISAMDAYIVKYLEAADKIEKGNRLLSTVKIELEKDPYAVKMFQRIHSRTAGVKQVKTPDIAYWINQIRMSKEYENLGGKYLVALPGNYHH